MDINIMKAELVDYKGRIDKLNKTLDDLEQQRQNVLRVGMRLEGVVNFLTEKIVSAEKSVADSLAAAEDALKEDANPATTPS